LPTIVSKIVNETIAKHREQDTVLNEIVKLNPDILKALYILAFKTYDGFDKF